MLLDNYHILAKIVTNYLHQLLNKEPCLASESQLKTKCLQALPLECGPISYLSMTSGFSYSFSELKKPKCFNTKGELILTLNNYAARAVKQMKSPLQEHLF